MSIIIKGLSKKIRRNETSYINHIYYIHYIVKIVSIVIRGLSRKIRCNKTSYMNYARYIYYIIEIVSITIKGLSEKMLGRIKPAKPLVLIKPLSRVKLVYLFNLYLKRFLYAKDLLFSL
jgi:hypothetical protein